MCEIQASKIFRVKRNNESESTSKLNVLQFIKNTFDEMCAAPAEREEAAKRCSKGSKDVILRDDPPTELEVRSE